MDTILAEASGAPVLDFPYFHVDLNYGVWEAWNLRTWDTYLPGDPDPSVSSMMGVILHSPQVYKKRHFLGFPMGQCHFWVGAWGCHGGRNPGRWGSSL